MFRYIISGTVISIVCMLNCFGYLTILLYVWCVQKVSQFMSRAARLNEAFSVVKRVPVIRPQLPATGVAPWPVMTKLALQEA